MVKNSPKILVLDIETAPILAHLWRLWKPFVSVDMMVEDSYIIAWAAMWVDADSPQLTGKVDVDMKRVIYRDQRRAKVLENDKDIVQELRDLIDEADMTLTHNGIDFDHPVINGRIALNRIVKPSSYRMIDTCRIGKRRFRLASMKLQYLTEKFNKWYKKLKHAKFPGFELWKECMAGNKEAWGEMELYNKYDVLSLAELYFNTMKPWDEETNWFIYQDDVHCRCGSTNFKKNGWHYNQTRKYQRYKCCEESCGYEWRDVRATRCSRFTSTVTR